MRGLIVLRRPKAAYSIINVHVNAKLYVPTSAEVLKLFKIKLLIPSALGYKDQKIINITQHPG